MSNYSNENNDEKQEKRENKQEEDAANPKIRCPQCGSTSYIPICYGYPSHEGFLKAQRGEIILAGCCVPFHRNIGKCKNCGTTF